MIDQQDQDSTEESTLGALGTAFADVRLDRGADTVMARGRALRRRRQAVPALAVAGIAAVSLSLALATQPDDGSAPGKTLAYNGSAVNVSNAAFSVQTDAKTGIITVTERQLFDPKQMQAALTKAGVRTDIEIKEFTPEPADTGGVIGVAVAGVVSQQKIPGGGVIIKINPALIPAGTVMYFAYFFVSGAPSSQGARAVAFAEGVSKPPSFGYAPSQGPTAKG
jgi:hypothetical protein